MPSLNPHNTQIHFGTDGWRGIIAEDFTFSNVRKVAQAIADYIVHRPSSIVPRRVIVGYDNRFLSKRYAETISEVLAANGIRVLLTEKSTPTPAVTLFIRKRKLGGGIIITASHNPPQFNGIKFKTHNACPADTGTTKKIEKLIGERRVKTIGFDAAMEEGLIKKVNLDKEYVFGIRRYLELDKIKPRRFNILVDYMHGTDIGLIEKVLYDTKCKIDTINANIDPGFGGLNPEPVPKNLKAILNIMKTQKHFDIGLALDGDGDRVAAVAPGGGYITSQQITALIALHFIENKGLRGAIVKTIVGSSLLEKIARKYNVKLFETPVGFKHISSLMLSHNVLVGGEEAGGIGVRDYIPERDGVLAGLLLLEMMAYTNKDIVTILKEVDRIYGKFRYARTDAEYPLNKSKRMMAKLIKRPPKKLLGKDLVKIKTYDGIKFIASDDSWLCLRFSGTEPLLRIYAEAHSDKGVARLLKFGKRLAYSG